MFHIIIIIIFQMSNICIEKWSSGRSVDPCAYVLRGKHFDVRLYAEALHNPPLFLPNIVTF